MLNTKASMILAGVTPEERRQASAPTNLHMVTGVVNGKSASGKTQVLVDGLVINADDSQYLEIDTLGGLEDGDTVTIILSGESGHGMHPLAIGSVGSIDRIDVRIGQIEADYVKATLLEAAVAEIGFLKATDAALEYATINDLTAATGRISDLEADHVTVSSFNAATGRIGDLEADHVTVSDFEAEKGKITALQTNTADIDTLRANSAKVANLTAAQLEAANAYISSLTAGNVTAQDIIADTAKVHSLTAAQLSAATAYIASLTAGNVTAANLIADHGAIGSLDSNYAQINMANVNNGWITNGTIKNGAIGNAMISDVSANKLTAGTIDASNITVTNLNADNITTGTINGQRIGEGSLSLSKLEEDVYTESEIDGMLSSMQAEIDGAIETWTGTAVPTLQNAPAVNWTTNAIKDTHVGDVYFVVNSNSQQNGYNYRFTKSGSSYSWQLIKDTDITNALSRLSTAEGKITQFDSDISTLQTDTGTLTTRTSSLETRMTTAEGDIADKVDTTTFNEVSNTVDSHSQTISQHTTAIASKADSSTVTSLTTRVSKNEQDISGINTTIGSLQTTVESKADGTTVSTLTSQVNSISDTVDGHTSSISSITSTQTTMQTTLNKTVKSSIQLWYTKANTTAPSAPTSKITSTSTSGNAWRTVVPSYNSSYPNYYYCWQYEYVDGTYGWSTVVRDIAMGESQSTSRTVSSNLASYITSNDAALQTLQNQVDGQIEAWYYSVDPTDSNAPASDWTTDALKQRHEGDLYYNVTNGHSWRWLKNGSTYSWQQIPDSDAAAALAAAQNAQTTANNKRRIFTATPTVPYDIGDLWVNGSEVKYATVARSSGSYTATDWTQTATDDTAATAAQTTANANIKSSVQLWFTKENTTAPSKPTVQVTTANANTANAWNLIVPTWNSSYPYYFYCYQQQKGDGTWQWSDVVYDRATSEAQQLANTVSTNLSTLQTDYATFKQTTQEFESTVGTTYATKTELDNRISVNDLNYLYRKTGNTQGVQNGIATVKSIRGNTVVWNQLCSGVNTGQEVAGLTRATGATGGLTITGTVTTAPDYNLLYLSNSVMVKRDGTKYLFKLSKPIGLSLRVSGFNTAYSESAFIWSNVNGGTWYASLCAFVDAGDEISFTDVHVSVFDLTQMFGAGNEPSTVAEFEALYPLPYYPYDSGTLKPVQMQGIETVGFNQWDEEWVNGYFTGTGAWFNDATTVASKNPIPVLPNTTYYFKINGSHNAYVTFWTTAVSSGATDQSHCIHRTTNVNNTTFTTPADCHAIHFNVSSTYGSTYNNDICINISDSSRNGTYEPYWSSERTIPVSTYFPTGMKSTGSVYDELTSEQAITRVGTLLIDGTNVKVAQSSSSSDGAFGYALYATSTGVTVDEVGGRNLWLFCDKFCGTDTNPNLSDMDDFTVKQGGISQGNGVALYFKLPSTINTVNAANEWFESNPTTLYYIIATPTTQEIDPPLNLTYKIDANGTERIMVDETQPAPIMDVVYGMDLRNSLGTAILDTDALEERVTTAETSITQNQTNIALKANASDVYTKTQTDGLISTEVTNRNAAIELSANNITSTVAENYTTKTDFNNLEIGGRNLVLNTSESKTSAASASNSTYITGWKLSDYGKNAINATDPLTISFDFTVSGNEALARVYSQLSGSSVTNIQKNHVTGETSFYTSFTGNGTFRYCVTFIPSSLQVASSATFKVRQRMQNATNGATFTMSNLKLEIGNRPTDWTPAPEDLETRVATAESSITQNATNIGLKVSKDTIIGEINLSSETAKIAASKVEIDGTAVFNSISSSVDSAITAKGYATTGQVATAKTEAINAAATDASAKANAVQTNLDNLEIGGRNLIRNGNFADGINYWIQDGSTSVVETDSARGTVLKVTPSSGNRQVYPSVTSNFTHEAGETYSLSFYAKADASNTLAVNRGGCYDVYGAFALTTSWQRFESTLTITGTGSLSFVMLADSTFYLSDIMLVHGNKPMDYIPDPRDQEAAINSARTWYAECPTVAATAAKVATITPATTEFKLEKGVSVSVKFTYANNVASPTLNVNGTGAIAIMRYGTTAPSTSAATSWQANSINTLTYDGTYWRLNNWLNDNTTYNLGRNLHATSIKVLEAVVSGLLMVGTSSGYKKIAAGVAFTLGYPILYSSEDYTANTTYTNTYETWNSVKYSNTAAIQSGEANKTIYLKGSISGNTFTIASSNVFTTVEPTSEDAFLYIPLGVMSSATVGNFVTSSTLYAYIDGKFRQVTPTEIVSTHRVYYRTATADSTLAAPSTWVAEATGNVYDAWSTKVPPLAASTEEGQTKYLYLYTCEQRKRLDGTIECTKVLLDENTTVIDGGQIITNSVTANQIAAGTVTAEEIAGGTITSDQIAAGAISADRLEANALTLGNIDGLEDRLAEIDAGLSTLSNSTQWVNFQENVGTVFGEEGSANNVTVKADGVYFNTEGGEAARASAGIFYSNEVQANGSISAPIVKMGNWALIQSGTTFSIEYLG